MQKIKRFRAIVLMIIVVALSTGCANKAENQEVSQSDVTTEVAVNEQEENKVEPQTEPLVVEQEAIQLVDNGVPVEERQRPMRILLINDDGYDAMGAQMLFNKLVEAGYEAWMVAPITNQSGTGTSIKWNKEPHELVEYGDNKYAFDGTPSDCFKVAVNYVMPEKPDLIISGVNDGPNFGEVQFNSGTVGGAARAVRHGYPAIASSLVFMGGENLEGFMIPAVDFTVDIVNKLNEEWKAGNMLMPLGSGLSINYPASTPEEIQGVKFIENEEVYTDFQNYAYDEEKGGIYNSMDMEKFMSQIQNPEIITDLTEANRGFVTITVIDGNWNADEIKVQYMQETLDGIEAVN